MGIGPESNRFVPPAIDTHFFVREHTLGGNCTFTNVVNCRVRPAIHGQVTFRRTDENAASKVIFGITVSASADMLWDRHQGVMAKRAFQGGLYAPTILLSETN